MSVSYFFALPLVGRIASDSEQGVIAMIDGPPLPSPLQRRDRHFAHAAAPERIGHEARGLHVLDEALEISEPGRLVLRRRHRLADLLKAAGHDAKVGMILG